MAVDRPDGAADKGAGRPEEAARPGSDRGVLEHVVRVDVGRILRLALGSRQVAGEPGELLPHDAEILAELVGEFTDQPDPALVFLAGGAAPASGQPPQVAGERAGQAVRAVLQPDPAGRGTVDLPRPTGHEHVVELLVTQVLVLRVVLIRHG